MLSMIFQSYFNTVKPMLGVAEGVIYDWINEVGCGMAIGHDNLGALTTSKKD